MKSDDKIYNLANKLKIPVLTDFEFTDIRPYPHICIYREPTEYIYYTDINIFFEINLDHPTYLLAYTLMENDVFGKNWSIMKCYSDPQDGPVEFIGWIVEDENDKPLSQDKYLPKAVLDAILK